MQGAPPVFIEGSDFCEAEVAWNRKAVEEPKGGGGGQEDEDQ